MIVNKIDFNAVTTYEYYDELPCNQETLDYNDPFTLFPNPAKDELHIRFLSVLDQSEVNIYEARGGKVLTENIVPMQKMMETILDISHLTSGVYFISIKTNGKVAVKNW